MEDVPPLTHLRKDIDNRCIAARTTLAAAPAVPAATVTMSRRQASADIAPAPWPSHTPPASRRGLEDSRHALAAASTGAQRAWHMDGPGGRGVGITTLAMPVFLPHALTHTPRHSTQRTSSGGTLSLRRRQCTRDPLRNEIVWRASRIRGNFGPHTVCWRWGSFTTDEQVDGTCAPRSRFRIMPILRDPAALTRDSFTLGILPTRPGNKEEWR